jgi:hypothetical protein
LDLFAVFSCVERDGRQAAVFVFFVRFEDVDFFALLVFAVADFAPPVNFIASKMLSLANLPGDFALRFDRPFIFSAEEIAGTLFTAPGVEATILAGSAETAAFTGFFCAQVFFAASIAAAAKAGFCCEYALMNAWSRALIFKIPST